MLVNLPASMRPPLWAGEVAATSTRSKSATNCFNEAPALGGGSRYMPVLLLAVSKGASMRPPLGGGSRDAMGLPADIAWTLQ